MYAFGLNFVVVVAFLLYFKKGVPSQEDSMST